MAALSSNKLHGLIDRFFALSTSQVPAAIFDIVRLEFAAVRAIVEADAPSGERADRRWLERTELRSTRQVAQYLEETGFRSLKCGTDIIFVDARCGLIRSETLGTIGSASVPNAAGRILRSASQCGAHGVILATRDLREDPHLHSAWSELTRALQSKGELIDVYLLDHFVLTKQGWRRMVTAETEGH